MYGFGKSSIEALERRKDIQAGKWGSWVKVLRVIQHTKRWRNFRRCYLIEESNKQQPTEGKVATESEVETIKEFTPSRTKDSSTQSEADLKGKAVVVAVDFSNIVWIKVGEINFHKESYPKVGVSPP